MGKYHRVSHKEFSYKDHVRKHFCLKLLIAPKFKVAECLKPMYAIRLAHSEY